MSMPHCRMGETLGSVNSSLSHLTLKNRVDASHLSLRTRIYNSGLSQRFKLINTSTKYDKCRLLIIIKQAL